MNTFMLFREYKALEMFLMKSNSFGLAILYKRKEMGNNK